jgi:quinol monooxygenase YgiN
LDPGIQIQQESGHSSRNSHNSISDVQFPHRTGQSCCANEAKLGNGVEDEAAFDADIPSKNGGTEQPPEPSQYSLIWSNRPQHRSGQVQTAGIHSTQESNSMEAIGLFVTLEARQGREADVEAFLKSAQTLALDEKGTLKWYAIRLGPGRFGIFDTFADEAGRNAHLAGEIAKALGARAGELLAVPPQIEKVVVLASTPLRG